MKTKVMTILMTLLFVTSSCVSVKVIIPPIYGFNSGYSKLTDEEKEMVIFTQEDTDVFNDSLCRSHFYAVTGKQFLDMISASEKTLVYTWSPNCTAESCLAIENVYEEGVKNGYDVFIVASYFSPEAISQVEGFEYAVFIPNFLYYGTDRCRKYERKFFIDIMGKENYNTYIETVGSPEFGRCLIFNNGTFSCSIRNLNEI